MRRNGVTSACIFHTDDRWWKQDYAGSGKRKSLFAKLKINLYKGESANITKWPELSVRVVSRQLARNRNELKLKNPTALEPLKRKQSTF